jgi:erythronate-4-phosphate dehydrogenase
MSARYVVEDQIPHLAEWLDDVDATLLLPGRSITNDVLRESGAVALFVRSTTRVDHALLENTNIRFVGSATAGIDHVDVDALRTRNITFASAPGSNAWAVAEYVMANILDLVPDLSTIRIGIVGVGNVGRRLAKAASRYGCSVVVNDPPLVDAGLLHDDQPYPVRDLAAIMSTCDVITVHTPLTPSGPHPTVDLINADLLATTKRDAIIINAARGGIVDERALVERHRAGHLTAVMDVYTNEPHIDPHTINSIERVTPHIAGYSLDAKRDSAAMVFAAYHRWKNAGGEQFVPSDLHQHPHADEPLPTLDDERAALRAWSAAFRHDWLATPTVATFDHYRKTYPLRPEVLRHWLY